MESVQHLLGAIQAILEMEQRESINSASRSVSNPIREFMYIEDYIGNISENKTLIEQYSSL